MGGLIWRFIIKQVVKRIGKTIGEQIGRIFDPQTIPSTAEEQEMIREYEKIHRSKQYFDDADRVVSPLALDLDRDGVETTALTYGAYFDHDKNGFAEQTGWVSSDDGLLVLDKNSDGIINDGGELFGNETVLQNGQDASNGFQALAELDGKMREKAFLFQWRSFC